MMFDCIWRPAAEVVKEDEEFEKEMEKAIQEQDSAPYQPPRYLCTKRVQDIVQHFDIKEWSEKKWREAQEQRLLAPIGTRVLIRRRYHSSSIGPILQDTIMIRVCRPHRWENVHVFYLQDEGTPYHCRSKPY